MTLAQRRNATYFRNVVFGIEDSLVSTVGLLSGIAVADVSRRAILLTGIVLIFVEAFSMAIGSFLAESSAEKYIHKELSFSRSSLAGGVLMFFSYFLAGFIPLLPYAVLAVDPAFSISIACSLAALFLLGVGSARFFNGRRALSAGIRTALLGGLAILFGILVGTALKEAL